MTIWNAIISNDVCHKDDSPCINMILKYPKSAHNDPSDKGLYYMYVLDLLNP